MPCQLGVQIVEDSSAVLLSLGDNASVNIGMHLWGLNVEAVVKGLHFSARSLTCDSLLHLLRASVAVTPTPCATPCLQ